MSNKFFQKWCHVFLALPVLILLGCQQDTPVLPEVDTPMARTFLSPDEVVGIHTEINRSVIHSTMDSVLRANLIGPGHELEIDRIALSVINHRSANLSINEKFVAEQRWRLTPTPLDTVGDWKSLSTLPDVHKEALKEALVNPDYEAVNGILDKIYDSQWYASLNSAQRHDVGIDLQLMLAARDNMLSELAYYSTTSRMSPGDRMVWSSAMSQLSDAQRKKVIAGILGSMTCMTAPLAEQLVTAIVNFISCVFL